MDEKGKRQAVIDHILKQDEMYDKRNKKRKKHLDKHPEDNDQDPYGVLPCALSYRDKTLKKVKKKRKKRYRKLWNHTVPLTRYKGCLFINQQMVEEKRSKRYQEERILYETFILSRKEEKTTQVIYKGLNLKTNYCRPSDRKYNDSGYERDARTFDQSSAVVESDGAAENANLYVLQICKQTSVDECTPCSVIGTTSLTSGTNQKICAEEDIIVRGLGIFYSLREIFTFSPMKMLKKYNKVSPNEPKRLRLDNSDCKCEAQTINHSSAVVGSGVAAENENMNSTHICRQSPANECTPRLENGTICLSSEIDLKNPADLFCIDHGSEGLEKFINQVFLNEVVCLESKLPVISLVDPYNPSNFTHAPSNGL
jgi:hypothetical protein